MDAFIRQNLGEVTKQWLHDKKLSHLVNGTQRHYLHALSGLSVAPRTGCGGRGSRRVRCHVGIPTTLGRWQAGSLCPHQLLGSVHDFRRVGTEPTHHFSGTGSRNVGEGDLPRDGARNLLHDLRDDV